METDEGEGIGTGTGATDCAALAVAAIASVILRVLVCSRQNKRTSDKMLKRMKGVLIAISG